MISLNKANISSHKFARVLQRRFNRNALIKFFVKLVRSVLVIGICFIILYPVLRKISVAVMDRMDLYDLTVNWIPRHFTLNNLKDAWRFMDYPRTIFNTLKITGATTVLQLFSSIFIGYGFARFKFKYRELLFGLVILTMVVPPQTIMVPLYVHFRYFDILGIISALTGTRGVNMIDSYWPFVMLSATGMGLRNGLFIYIARQFFKGIPRELEEASLVDGAGAFRTFFTIMLPSAVPVMITITLFSIVWQWNNSFYYSLFFQTTRTLPVALSGVALTANTYYRFTFGISSGAENTLSPGFFSMINNSGIILTVLPIVLLYVFLQRYFVESIERSGVVG